MKISKIVHLDMIPRSPDLAVLALRLWFGLSLLFLHGWGKLMNFSQVSTQFPAIFINSKISLGLAVFAEVFLAALLAVGLATRFAALGCLITMAVAFTKAHGMALKGPNNGEMAFIYLGAFLAIFIAGPGRFSLDAAIAGKK